MKINNKIKTGLIISFLSHSLILLAFPVKAYNRGAWMEKKGEYFYLWWWVFGWELTIEIITERTYDPECGHYFISSHAEEYDTLSYYWSWTEYSENIDIYRCPICHRPIIITYEVHGRFSYIWDSSNYYDITLKIEYDASDNIEATFGPCYNHLVGKWQFFEDSGLISY